jgi:hypothetical protein
VNSDETRPGMTATFRFYAELNDFLPQARAQRELRARRGFVYREGSRWRRMRAIVDSLAVGAA